MEVKVAERRKELGYTQAQLAERVGIGQHTVSDIETGRHVPFVDVAIRICRALDRNVEDLFVVDGEGHAKPL